VEHWSGGVPSRPFAQQAAVPVDKVVEVRVLGYHRIAAMLRSDGTVVTYNGSAVVQDIRYYADRPYVPRPPDVSDIVSIAAGDTHVLALRRNGTVLAWGSNKDHECDVPSDLRNVVSISANGATSYALTNDGQVVKWGAN